MKQPLKPSRHLMAALTAAIVVYWVRRQYRGKPAQTTDTCQDADLRSYRRYATTHHAYRIWPDRLIGAFNFPTAVTLVIVPMVVFTLGLVIAWPFGFTAGYVVTPAVYVGLAGILLVVGACHWGSLRVHPDYEQLRPVFTVDDATYFQILDKGFTTFRSKKAIAVSSLLFFIVGFVGLILAYATSASTRRKFDLQPLRPNLILPAWYSHRFEDVGFSILLVYLILISITIGTGGWLLVANMLFLSKLRRLPVIPMPTIVRTRLRRVADLYVGTSLAWSFGVALFGILFYKDYNILSGVFLASLFIIGVLMFALPQVICRNYIVQSHERLCAMGLAELYGDLGLSLQERHQDLATGERVAGNLSDLYSMTDRPKTLVYDVQNVVLWIGSELVALIAILPHTILIRLLH